MNNRWRLAYEKRHLEQSGDEGGHNWWRVRVISRNKKESKPNGTGRKTGVNKSVRWIEPGWGGDKNGSWEGVDIEKVTAEEWKEREREWRRKTH